MVGINIILIGFLNKKKGKIEEKQIFFLKLFPHVGKSNFSSNKIGAKMCMNLKSRRLETFQNFIYE